MNDLDIRYQIRVDRCITMAIMIGICTTILAALLLWITGSQELFFQICIAGSILILIVYLFEMVLKPL